MFERQWRRHQLMMFLPRHLIALGAIVLPGQPAAIAHSLVE